MGVTTTQTNKPLNPRGNDQSPLAYNRAKLFSGKALSFDGVNDYISTPNISVQSTNVWTYTGNVYVDQNDAYWFDARTSEVGYGVYFRLNKINLFSSSGGEMPFNFSFELEKWQNISITSDGTNARLYVNGVLVDTISYSSSFSSSGNLTIGLRHNLSGFPYNGKMGGFKIFNTALTAAQVADLYNNPEKVVPTGVDNTALKLWLPMQEGAGTTAYDGSGNGNHGTISGATYTHGIGAPVSQTAVIDWNKGVNYLAYSEDFDQWTELVPGTGSVSVTSNFAEAPDGSNNATRLQASAGSDYGLISQTASSSTTGNYISAVWAKSNTGSTQSVAIYGRGDSSNVVNVTTDWTRITKQSTGSTNYLNIGSLSPSDASVDILIWGASINHGTEVDSYVRTGATAQTSEVLLPQGLTTGRDITGVNLFENVRKQGALNLDGSSWGKIHPNDSFAFGTGAFSMESWAKLEYVNSGSYANEIIALNDLDDWAIKTFSTGVSFAASAGVSLSHTITLDNSWAHIVGVRNADGSMKLYINGVEEESNAAGSSTASVPVTNPVRLGTDNTERSRAYKDQIAQPRIYNRALTAAEVLQNYNSGKNTYK